MKKPVKKLLSIVYMGLDRDLALRGGTETETWGKSKRFCRERKDDCE